MNCCNHNNNHNNHNKRGHNGRMGHMWMMLLCCGLPITVLAVISLLGTSFPAIRSALYSVLPFLCPVLMIAMLPMMLRKDKNDGERHCDGHEQQTDTDAAQDGKFLK